MTNEAKLIAGITLITVPTIQYGGYFLLRSLMDPGSGYMTNALRQNFFRAGHAHAGVLVILSGFLQGLTPEDPLGLYIGSYVCSTLLSDPPSSAFSMGRYMLRMEHKQKPRSARQR